MHDILGKFEELLDVVEKVKCKCYEIHDKCETETSLNYDTTPIEYNYRFLIHERQCHNDIRHMIRNSYYNKVEILNVLNIRIEMMNYNLQELNLGCLGTCLNEIREMPNDIKTDFIRDIKCSLRGRNTNI